MTDKQLEINLLRKQLEMAQDQNRLLQNELAATNQGFLALTMELEQKNEEAQSATHLLMQMARMSTMGELAASIAHELNNPMAIISLRIESLMAQLPCDDGKQKLLKIISSEVDRMANLISSLLDFSRRHNQRIISSVDVSREIEYSLELIDFRFRKSHVQINRFYQPDLPMLEVDRAQLQQVFLNLFTNASDAMPRGGVLTISISEDVAESACLAIDISDSGSGIHPDDLVRVMDPFYTTKPEGKGTGLGLSICRSIVHENHGRITISSEVGQGTTVSLKFPIAFGKCADQELTPPIQSLGG
ncbi:MAG TPA: ATP-binding protein [Syntrophomonadaceae bacterium]|nr:ATP-binding protein [Syntrophomonadaceae bacterium]